MQSTATSLKIVTTIAETRDAIAQARADGARIGFVPTMGALHAGHTSLVERSRREADFTVLSIFVNPLQFAPTEDLSRYPRPVQDDERLASDANVARFQARLAHLESLHAHDAVASVTGEGGAAVR